MKGIGLEPERLKMVQLSSAMGLKFAEEAQRMTEDIQALGPSPLRRGSGATGKAEEWADTVRRSEP
jgi:coenzyme F420-reducing hydrogenase delta subunit